MHIHVQNAEALTGQQVHELLTGNERGIGFMGESRAGICAWTERLLVAQEFLVQSKERRDAIRRHASKIGEAEAAADARLVRSYAETGPWN